MNDRNAIQDTSSKGDNRFIDIDGLQVHCRVRGCGSPALLFMHGSFLSLRSWRLVFDRLAEHNVAVAIDRPAFGMTSRPLPVSGKRNPYTPEGQADLVVELLDRLGLRDAVLIGNSTGGTIALLTALRHPDRVRGLVLADPMVYSGYATSEFPRWLYPVFKAIAPFGSRMASVMIRLAFGKLHRTFLCDESLLSRGILEGYRSDLMQGNWGRAFWELLLGSHNLKLEEHLHKIAVPALVMTGDQDRMVKPGETIRLSRELPGAELHVVADCGHLPQEEKPDFFAERVSAFLVNHFQQ